MCRVASLMCHVLQQWFIRSFNFVLDHLLWDCLTVAYTVQTTCMFLFGLSQKQTKETPNPASPICKERAVQISQTTLSYTESAFIVKIRLY